MVTDFSSRFKLLAVTKGRSAQDIADLLNKNPVIFRIGENRVDEAERKFEELHILLGDRYFQLEKHFIGKLQSRKIRSIARLFEVVESLENKDQALRLSQAATELNKTLDVFIEVNVSGIEERSGVQPEAFDELKDWVRELPHLNLVGVMGMATPDERAREQFKTLKKLQDDLLECSMGMSEDYLIAMEEGATLLRLGRVLFEEGLPRNVNFE